MCRQPSIRNSRVGVASIRIVTPSRYVGGWRFRLEVAAFWHVAGRVEQSHGDLAFPADARSISGS
eukprot:7043580-Pyramimonas_sp.AAC.1